MSGAGWGGKRNELIPLFRIGAKDRKKNIGDLLAIEAQRFRARLAFLDENRGENLRVIKAISPPHHRGGNDGDIAMRGEEKNSG